jgi:hypothetical protein
MRKLVDDIDEFGLCNVMLCALILFFFIRFVLQFGKPSPNLTLFIETHLILALGFWSENGSKDFDSSVKHLVEVEKKSRFAIFLQELPTTNRLEKIASFIILFFIKDKHAQDVRICHRCLFAFPSSFILFTTSGMSFWFPSLLFCV